MKAKGTSFATLKDLVGYIDCLLAGGSETHCYNHGDNGRGCWGDVTAQLDTAMVALPESEMIKKWGSKKAAKHKKIWFKLDQGSKTKVEAIVADQSPDGIIDLNPASLMQAGLPSDTELSCNAEWDWI